MSQLGTPILAEQTCDGVVPGDGVQQFNAFNHLAISGPSQVPIAFLTFIWLIDPLLSLFVVSSVVARLLIADLRQTWLGKL